MQEHHVDIARGIELAATVTPNCDQAQGNDFLCGASPGCGAGCAKDVPQDNVDQLRAPGTNLTSATAGFMPEPEPMILDLEELGVERDQLRWVDLARGGKFALRVLQNFILLTGHSLGCEIGRATCRERV